MVLLEAGLREVEHQLDGLCRYPTEDLNPARITRQVVANRAKQIAETELEDSDRTEVELWWLLNAGKIDLHSSWRRRIPPSSSSVCGHQGVVMAWIEQTGTCSWRVRYTRPTAAATARCPGSAHGKRHGTTPRIWSPIGDAAAELLVEIVEVDQAVFKCAGNEIAFGRRGSPGVGVFDPGTLDIGVDGFGTDTEHARSHLFR